MLCAAGGLLITAGTLLTIYEAVRRPRTINVTRELEERIASGNITTLRVGGGRSGLVLVAIGAALLAVAATTTAQTG
jgi:hypothetical protein